MLELKTLALVALVLLMLYYIGDDDGDGSAY